MRPVETEDIHPRVPSVFVRDLFPSGEIPECSSVCLLRFVLRGPGDDWDLVTVEELNPQERVPIDSSNLSPDPGGKPNPKAKGDGTSARGGDEKSKNEKKKKSESNLEAEGGNPDSPKGGGSGGNKTDDPTGTPKPDSEIEKVNKSKDIKDQPEGEENKAEPDSPGQTERESKRNSPSKKGDRAGGGGRGG